MKDKSMTVKSRLLELLEQHNWTRAFLYESSCVEGCEEPASGGIPHRGRTE